MRTILIFLFLFIQFVVASQNRDTTVELSSGNRYTISLNTLPKPTGYVNDFSGLYTEPQVMVLESLIRAFEVSKDIQIALVTIPGHYLSKNESFEKYTLRLLNAWGVGKRENNRGILIGLSNDLREMRIQNGYGIEKLISDKETKEIIDSYFIPYLKQGDNFKAMHHGVKALIEKLIKNGA